ncbi:hypothetical protein JCM5353_000655 [Sporobolomyces roseus]
MKTRSSTARERKLEAQVKDDKVASSPQSETPLPTAHLLPEPPSDPPKPTGSLVPISTPCRLPPELLDQIFESISRNQDFASLARVCRQFLHIARSRLYHTIVLDLSEYGAPSVVRRLLDHPACALHVKTVEVGFRAGVIYENDGGYARYESSLAPTPQVVFDALEDALCNLSNLKRIYSKCTQRFDYESHEILASLLVKYCPKLQILDLPSATFNFASSLSLLTQLPLLEEIRSNPCTNYSLPRTSTPVTAKLHILRFSRPLGDPRALPWILHSSGQTLHTLSLLLQDGDGIDQCKWKPTTKAQPVDLSFLSNLRHLTIHVRASSALPATLKSALHLPISRLTLVASNIELSKIPFLHLLPRRLEHLSIGPSGYMRLLDWSPLLLPSNPCPNLKIVELAGGGNPETCSKTTFNVDSTAEVPIKYGFEVRWIIDSIEKDRWGNVMRLVKDGPDVHWEKERDLYAPTKLEGWRVNHDAPAKEGQEETFKQSRIRRESQGIESGSSEVDSDEQSSGVDSGGE